jgi:hypothetical protein
MYEFGLRTNLRLLFLHLSTPTAAWITLVKYYAIDHNLNLFGSLLLCGRPAMVLRAKLSFTTFKVSLDPEIILTLSRTISTGLGAIFVHGPYYIGSMLFLGRPTEVVVDRWLLFFHQR